VQKEERNSADYFYHFYYYNILADHRVREAEDFDKENPDQTFMNGESTPSLWHENLNAFFEAYEIPPGSPSEAERMAQTLEDSPEAVLYTVTKPGQPFILSMEYPDHTDEVLMRGEEAKNLIAFWLDQGTIESMGRDHWGAMVLEYFATPWSAKELGIPNKVAPIEEAIEDDLGGTGEFEKPKARPFRRAFLLQQILTQLQIDYPGCPFTHESDRTSRSDDGAVTAWNKNEWRGYFGNDPRGGDRHRFGYKWALYLHYQTSRRNPNKLYIYGNLHEDGGRINHGFRYYYDKKTETVTDFD
jgi:hypothetical protein